MLFGQTHPISPNHTIVTDASQLGPMVAELRAYQDRGLDFETGGTRFWAGQLPVGWAAGVWTERGPRCWYVPVAHRTMEVQCNPAAARAAFQDAYEGAGSIIGHNLGFDLNMARSDGWKLPAFTPLHDTLIQAMLIHENRSLALENVVGEHGWSPYGDAHAMKDQLETWLRQRAKERKTGIKGYLDGWGHSEVPVYLEGEYSCRDVGHTLALDRNQRWRAQGWGAPWEARRRSLYDTEMLLVRALADITFRGQLIDTAYLSSLASELDVWLDQEGRELIRLFGVQIEWHNDNQLRDLLFNRLRLPILSFTDKRQPSVDRAALMTLHKLHPGIERLAEWRAHQKVRTTYTTSLLDKVGPDGRLHADFVQWGTATGRLSSRNPNLQNIPSRHKKLAKMVRRAFTVDPGFARVLIDYSQIELRQLAWATGAPSLLSAYDSPAYMALLRGDIDYDTYRWHRRFEPSVDVHGNVAREVFGAVEVPEGAPGWDDWYVKRSASKVINFGVPYGAGPNLLMADPKLRLSEADAVRFFEEYHRSTPEVRQTQQSLFATMYQQRDEWGPYFVNWAGRMRHGPRLLWNRRKGPDCPVAEEERGMFASLIQGGAAELTKISLVRLWCAQQAGTMPAFTSGTVHDEIALDCPASEARYVAAEGQRIMEDFTGLFGSTPIVAEVELTTTDWSAKHHFDFWEAAA